jgi:hypothetical protein
MKAQTLLLPFFPDLPMVSEPCGEGLAQQAGFYAGKLLAVIARVGAARPLDEQEGRLGELCRLVTGERGAGFEQARDRVRRMRAAERESRYQLYSLANENFLLRKLVEFKGDRPEEKSRLVLSKLGSLYDDMLVVFNYTQKNTKLFRTHQVYKRTVEALFDKFKAALSEADPGGIKTG